MNRLSNWFFSAVVPAGLAGVAVSCLIEADNAYAAANWAGMSASLGFGLGTFVALFMYLDWNKSNYTE